MYESVNDGMVVEGIEISNPDKIIFPTKGITKGDMVSYYDKVAEYMLPWLKDRPLTLQRFPSGIDDPGFYQKSAGDYFPDFVERVTVETAEGSNEQIICNDKKTLIYLANQGVVTYHIWLSRKGGLHHPDKVVYDLDSSGNPFEKVKDAAKKVRRFLKDLGHDPQLMTTGKTGLHLFYQKRPKDDFEQVRQEAKKHADNLASKYPDLLTTETLKKNRTGRIFLDYLRNAYAQTAVCPYSLRPIPSAGVATPVEWRELQKINAADKYHYGNIFRRLARK